MKAILTVIVLLILAGLGCYFGSPYYTTWRLEQAAKAGDANTIASFTDFPSVRANLSPHLVAVLQAKVDAEKAKPHSFLDRIGMAIVPLFQGKAVDTLVTPQGLTVMLKTAGPPTNADPLHQGREPDAAHPGEPYTLGEGYTNNDLDQFHIAIGNHLRPRGEVDLKLLRRGFFTWKVTQVDLLSTPVSKTTPTDSD